MKLRIYQNTLRLRLQMPEITTIIASGRVEASILLGPDRLQSLYYSLSGDADSTAINVVYEGNKIDVIVPMNQLLSWANSDQVGIYHTIEIGEGHQLRITIEKDFKCLDDTQEDQSIMFPNPKAAC